MFNCCCNDFIPYGFQSKWLRVILLHTFNSFVLGESILYNTVLIKYWWQYLSWHCSLWINLFSINDMRSGSHACIYHFRFSISDKAKTAWPVIWNNNTYSSPQTNFQIPFIFSPAPKTQQNSKRHLSARTIKMKCKRQILPFCGSISHYNTICDAAPLLVKMT